MNNNPLGRALDVYLKNARELDYALEKAGGSPGLTGLMPDMKLRDFLITCATNNVKITAVWVEPPEERN